MRPAGRGCCCAGAPCRSGSRRYRRRNPGSAASRATRTARRGSGRAGCDISGTSPTLVLSTSTTSAGPPPSGDDEHHPVGAQRRLVDGGERRRARLQMDPDLLETHRLGRAPTRGSARRPSAALDQRQEPLAGRDQAAGDQRPQRLGGHLVGPDLVQAHQQVELPVDRRSASRCADLARQVAAFVAEAQPHAVRDRGRRACRVAEVHENLPQPVERRRGRAPACRAAPDLDGARALGEQRAADGLGQRAGPERLARNRSGRPASRRSRAGPTASAPSPGPTAAPAYQPLVAPAMSLWPSSASGPRMPVQRVAQLVAHHASGSATWRGWPAPPPRRCAG